MVLLIIFSGPSKQDNTEVLMIIMMDCFHYKFF